jgi:hypothetical protein
VYKTNINDIALNKLENKIKEEKNATEMLEKFINLNENIGKINYGLAHVNYNCQTPIDSYVVFFWIVILIILLYLLFEYIYKKSEKNI